jgi:hypothetical protein
MRISRSIWLSLILAFDPARSDNGPLWTLQDVQERALEGKQSAPVVMQEPVASPPSGGIPASLLTIYAALPQPNPEAGGDEDVKPPYRYWSLNQDAWGPREAVSPSFSLTAPILAAGYYGELDFSRPDVFNPYHLLNGVMVFGLTGLGQPLNAEIDVPAPVPQTGMKTIFGQRPRADGDYQAGVEWSMDIRFLVGEGGAANVITDTLTGLQWLRNPAPQRMTFEEAIEYSSSLDGSSGRGGFSDWRIPNLRELESILVYGQTNDVDFVLLPLDNPVVRRAEIWSSTHVANQPSWAWVIDARTESQTSRQLLPAEKIFRYFPLPVRGP